MSSNKFDFVVNEGVYPPAEDTYLLIDSLVLDKYDTFLEVGCGAGLVSLTAALIVKRVVSIDVSLEAVRNTKENIKRNGLTSKCDVFQSDLLVAFNHSTKYSIMCFNPPYLPEDDMKTELDHALIGGLTGVELTNRFILQASRFLQKLGSIYVVVSTLANVSYIENTMKSCGLDVRSIAKQDLFFETIQIVKGISK